jgi:hypothetical protein
MTDYGYWGKRNLICELVDNGEVQTREQLLPEPPPELAELLEEH